MNSVGPVAASPRLIPGPTTARVLAFVGGFLAVAFFLTLVVVSVPPTLGNYGSTIADGRTTTTLDDDGSAVEVIVPAEWSIVRDGEGAASVRTPDGAMTAYIDIADESPDAVIADAPDLASAERGETLASGLEIVHADLATGEVIASARTDGGTVRVVASVDDDHEMTDYRPALAELLEGITP